MSLSFEKHLRAYFELLSDDQKEFMLDLCREHQKRRSAEVVKNMELTDSEKTLVHNIRYVDAIKAVRERCASLSILDAKTLVDNYRDSLRKKA